jgi:hypothetical protein
VGQFECVTGVAKNSVTKLLMDLGQACAEYQDAVLVDLPCTRIECDEIWSFCYAKEKKVPADRRDEFGYGDVWTWTAICADTKLVPTWLIGERDGVDAEIFMRDLASRLRNDIQLTAETALLWRCATPMQLRPRNFQQTARTFRRPMAAAETLSQWCHKVRIRRVDGARLETVSTGQAGSRVIARQPNSARSGASAELLGTGAGLSHGARRRACLNPGQSAAQRRVIALAAQVRARVRGPSQRSSLSRHQPMYCGPRG